MQHFLPERLRTRPGDDPIFALNREATQRKSAGESVINATVGALLEDDGTLAVLPSVVRALREVPAIKGAGYAPIAGAQDFLDAAVKDLLDGSPLASIATAAATPGGSGALKLALTAFLERGQSVLCSEHYWGPYSTLCDENDRTLRTFRMFDEAGNFDVGSFARGLDELASSQGRVLVFLNDPCNNPTGYSLSDAEWEGARDALISVAKRVPTALLCDVAYLAFAKDTRHFLTFVTPVAEHALVLFAYSASKAFAQYGARVGALIACTPDDAQRGEIQRALSYACRGSWSNCNAAGQAAIARCITDAELASSVRAERTRLRGLLAARVDAFNLAARGTSLKYPRYDGGFFVTVFAKEKEGRATAERLKKRGVFVVPQGQSALRVALCSVPEAQIGALVGALAEETGA